MLMVEPSDTTKLDVGLLTPRLRWVQRRVTGSVALELSMNAEGDPFDLEQKELAAELGKSRMLPYGEILGAILDGNPLLTIRGDEAEELWRIVEPVYAAWRAGEVPLEEYAAGSDGPGGW